MNTLKILLSGCTTIIFLLFGDDMTPLILALTLLVIDTITGRIAAGVEQRKGTNKVESNRAWRLIEKIIAIFSAFVTANVLGIFTPDVREALLYLVAASVIWVEGMSIFENIERIDNRFTFKKVRELISKLAKK